MAGRLDTFTRALPGLGEGIGTVIGAIRGAGVPETTLELVHLRVSQINGCAFCVDTGTKGLRKNGEPDERIDLVAVWREAPGFTDAERAALALGEAATRIADRPDPVPDDDLGRGGPALRPDGARRARRADRPDEPVQPRQRHHPPAGRRLVMAPPRE